MAKLTIKIDVPDSIYCGFPGVQGKKCHMCLHRANGDYICIAYGARLQCDVSGPLKMEDCERKTSNVSRIR